ncbi:MAG TPA: VOC family protein, partial [Acidimicrobiia bacterium]|nr:VOC family protein [Acidimicrobiia bacterium]
MVDLRLEVVVLPVSDVDRAKAFYEQAGFVLDVDHQANEHFRVVQFTPPGSDCSITFGIGLGETPASPLKGIHLCVADIEEAVGDLSGRGIDCSPIRHMGPAGWEDGPDPEHRKYGSYSGFTDPDGNGFVLQEVGPGTSRDD